MTYHIRIVSEYRYNYIDYITPFKFGVVFHVPKRATKENTNLRMKSLAWKQYHMCIIPVRRLFSPVSDIPVIFAEAV